jgi:phospholipase C
MTNARDSLLPQVKNIVFLMLENRSLDNVLGWLYAGSAPRHVFPNGSAAAYDGLVAGKFSNPDSNGSPVLVQPVPNQVWNAGYSPPYWDPFEMLRRSEATWPLPPYPWNPPRTWNGVMNQLFADQRALTGMPSQADGAPRMKGFLQDYYVPEMSQWKGHDILWSYTPEQLTVMNGLARSFAVSDRWFSSVPSQTNPNRAYSICGTSLGRESNQNWQAQEQFYTPTIFNSLARAGKSLGLYFTDYWMGSKSYTEYTFPGISDAQPEIAQLDMFFMRAAAGNLPDFSYLEPKWGGVASGGGTDYHPGIDWDVRPAEVFLRRVFQALRNGKQWAQTLFVVTFDEHGGNYDHVPPPWGAINPDGINGIENGFKFDLFGARVPTLLISPFVQPSTVFRAPAGSEFPFDHTSFIKTLLLWAGVDPGAAKLGKRMAKAPSFERMLAQDHVNSENPALELPQAPTQPASPVVLHPAGNRETLQRLLAGIPVVPTRTILGHNSTLSDIEADAARYRADPEKFEAELEASCAPKR